MENNNLLSTMGRSVGSLITEREREMAVLFVDICNFFGLTTSTPEQTTFGLNGSQQEFDYLLAISG